MQHCNTTDKVPAVAGVVLPQTLAVLEPEEAQDRE
jgi:hypothetical protein